jgi:uncharacterized protein
MSLLSRAAFRPRLGLLLCLATLLTAASAWAAAPTFPPLTGRVVDAADILPAEVEADLSRKLEVLEAQTQRQLVVATLADLQGYEIEEYGYQLGRSWGIGQQGVNNGVLFLVAPAQRKVRIEVGYGLEGVLTDALSSLILQTQVLPRFKSGDMAGGVVAGTDALIEQLTLDAPAAQQRLAAAEAAAGASEAIDPQVVMFLVFVALWIVISIMRRRRGGAWWIAPVILGGGHRGWSGGGGRRGGGGGGFRGGGGSFGGGGSSGSW